MILTLPNRAPRGFLGRLGAVVLLVVWCGFSLTGAQEPAADAKVKYEPTEAGMRQHAQVLFAQVKELPGGDINGDGEVTKDECWAYVTAVVLNQPEAVVKAYPWADQNHDGKLDFEEAFYFARGDYDFKELEAKFKPDIKKADTTGNEEKKVQLKTKLSTAQYATWHVVLDRRAKLIADAKTLPTAEFVHKLYDGEMKTFIANSEFDQLVQGVKEVAKAKDEAKKLRTKLASAGTADKPKLEKKLQELETIAAEMTGKLQAEINTRLAALDAGGSTDEAERYRGLLKKLESL